MNSKLCASYYLYFFNLIERMNYYDDILKLVFEKNILKYTYNCKYTLV